MFRSLALVFCMLSLAGCKLGVLVVEGGEVQSVLSGTCLEGSTCLHVVNDTTYSETFTASPRSGWEFVRWNAGDGFLCADSVNPVCVVSNLQLAGVEAAEAIVASNSTFYIMPIFERITPPNGDVLYVGGHEWMNPDLFRTEDDSYSVNALDIAAACPWNSGLTAYVCTGSLGGIDVNGWAWATEDKISIFADLYERDWGGATQEGALPFWPDLMRSDGWVFYFWDLGEPDTYLLSFWLGEVGGGGSEFEPIYYVFSDGIPEAYLDVGYGYGGGSVSSDQSLPPLLYRIATP
jgi:hypothetical protein